MSLNYVNSHDSYCYCKYLNKSNSKFEVSNIFQVDGNISVNSYPDCTCCDNLSDSEGTTSRCDQDCDQMNEETSHAIPVIITQRGLLPLNNSPIKNPPAWFDLYEPRAINPKQSKVNMKTIRRDNRLMMSHSLPIISVSNLRSLWPKINNFKIDMQEREITVALLSEVWEKANCKKQQFELEKMLNMEGLKYISTPRMTKRGGGAAIVVSQELYTLEKIPVLNPDKVEVVFGLMRPKNTTSKIREIIIAAFYSPPKSRKNPLLLDHLLSTSLFLLSKYPSAGLVIGGDKNNLNISPLLNGIPRLKQIVTQPTHNRKVLDIILTNMHQLYSIPIIAPPVPPDDPLCGVPSDHSTPIAIPLSTNTVQQTREFVTKVSRPLPDSGILEFGEWICSEDWTDIPDNVDPTSQVIEFEKLLNKKLDVIFPKKLVRINLNHDKPFITAELKKLDRSVKREYRKNQKSAKYKRLKENFDQKYKTAAADYLEKAVISLKEDDPGKAYRCLKKMAAQPGDHPDEGSFTLLSHVEENLTAEESIEKIAQHFANISQEFPPLDYNLLPAEVQAKLDKPAGVWQLPDIPDHDVYQKIRKSKKPRSSVPGDLPRRIIQEFGPELATPAGKIFRNIVKTGHWPKPWRIEYGTPLKKETNPITEDQLRIISLTSYFSKVFEQYVVIWLLEFVGDQMDWGQYGGAKGCSISHYLIDFVNFILYNQDLKVPHAVLAVMIDFSKAFNRINHNTIITILSKMGVPGWLLRIVIGFLTNRELIVRYKGGTSDRKMLPGGGPQGTRLGLFLFLILINAAGYEHLQENIGEHMTQKKNKRTVIPNIHMKFVDDMTLAEAMNLKECLVPNPDPNPPQPLAYHDRTEHLLAADKCKMQEQLDKMVLYCNENDMKINTDKTKVVLFNTARKYDFMPKFSIENNTWLEVVEELSYLV